MSGLLYASTLHAHHCMYFVGPNIPVIVGVTVGVGVPLLIIIVTVAVAYCLVRYGKQKW